MIFFGVIILVLAVVGLGVAFGGNTPDVMGHSAGEIEKCADGEFLVMSGGSWTCGIPAGGSSTLSNCAWTSYGICGASGGPTIECPSGKVVIGVDSAGCTSGTCGDVTRCAHMRVKCCDIA